MRLIDADRLKSHYSWWKAEYRRVVDDIVDYQPTVEATVVVRGRWVVGDCDEFAEQYHCSVCGKQIVLNIELFNEPKPKYCSACGAKMVLGTGG